jgi:hypothetical protein
MIFWREFRGVIVALIGACEDCNLATQSVFITFLLKEVQRLREEEAEQRRRGPDELGKTLAETILERSVSLLPSFIT